MMKKSSLMNWTIIVREWIFWKTDRIIRERTIKLRSRLKIRFTKKSTWNQKKTDKDRLRTKYVIEKRIESFANDNKIFDKSYEKLCTQWWKNQV